jgi:hypothetical protein
MSITRRRFLKRTFAFSAALAAWDGNPLPAPAEQLAAQGAPCHLLAVGDYGVMFKDIARQQAVANGMAAYARKTQVDLTAMLMLGDNFYGGLSGKGVRSPRWRTNLEDMYPAATYPCPMYAVLGNHDYNDEPERATVAAELNYRKANPASRWTLPAKWYRLELPKNNPLATFLMIDTDFVYNDEKMLTAEETARQFDWLKGELVKPRTTPWLFVVGHHPVFSTGMHGDTPMLVEQLDPLLTAHKVDLYLSGHDHDLQHLEIENHPTSFVVSGAGGARAREGDPHGRGPFARYVYGFSHLELAARQFTLRHLDANGTQLHAFRKTTDGEVTTVG